jgi:ribosomal protein L7Ae-like RNA K-turn-binding protein
MNTNKYPIMRHSKSHSEERFAPYFLVFSASRLHKHCGQSAKIHSATFDFEAEEEVEHYKETETF